MKNRTTATNSRPTKTGTNNNSTVAQQTRILDALIVAKNQGLTTIEIREDLNCLHPSGRIMELREQGYRIECVFRPI